MANKDGALGSGASGTLRVTAVEGTVDIANNRSQVSVSLVLISTGMFYGFHDGSASINLAGSQIGSTSGTPTDIAANQTKTVIGATTVWVTHDSDGTKTVSFEGFISLPSWPLTANTGLGSLALTSIVQAPSAPDTVAASRVNDSQITVTWDNNSSTHHEYASLNIYRSTDGGGFALIASGLSASATTYSDTGTSANHKYAYKIEAVNAAGSAQSSASSAVWTTPGAPTSCTATKLANNNVKLTWSNHVNYSEYTTRVEESTDGGSTWTEIDSVSTGVATYTATAPSTSVTHKYRVRARSTTGSLNSAYATSGTVTLLSTAGAPTGLSPAGLAVDATADIVLTWTHNPTDGTPQSKRRVQRKIDTGSYSDVVNDSSTDSSYTITGGTLSNGHTITWKVSTAGQNGTLSAFSAESTFTTVDAPTVTISTPDTDTSALTAAWTYFQTQGHAQAGWVAQLLDDDGNVLETRSGTDDSSTTFTAALLDATTYTVTITVTSSDGLSSALASQDFTTDFLPPADIAVTASYDSSSGSMVLTLTGDAPVTDETEAIDTVDILRQIDGGDWVTFATGIVLDEVSLTATVLDTRPTINGINTYKAVAYSALPSSVESSTVDVTTSEASWSFLSLADGSEPPCRLKNMPQFGTETSRTRALHNFAGRPKPVALSGEATSKAITVSARLFSGSSRAEEFESIATTTGVVLWREPTGRRLFCALGKVTTTRKTRIYTDLSFGLTEVDYTE